MRPATKVRLPLIGLLLLTGCSSRQSGGGDAGSLPSMPITLPGGKLLRAEVVTTKHDIGLGLKFRTSLPPDHGMLFVLLRPGHYPFWMYQTVIPLDIIWLGNDRSIVFISANTPPCPPAQGENCPTYGGEALARYVVELAGGAAAGYGLKLGDRLQF
jgi:uncharacterized membrane protein (UPF0127 family)